MGVANLIDFGFPCIHETNEWSTEVLHFCRLLSFLLSQRTTVGTTLYRFAHCIQLCQIWVWFISKLDSSPGSVLFLSPSTQQGSQKA